MRRILFSTVAAAGLAAILAVVVLSGADTKARGPAPPTSSSAIPASADRPAPEAPPWPAEAGLGLRPTVDGAPAGCATPREGVHFRDPGRGWPRTIEALAHQSRFAAIVRAETQKSYWSWPDPGAPETPDGVYPTTTTNYRVERILKGSLPAVVQLDQLGARTDASFPCSSWAYEIENDPLPVIGHSYVLFLEDDLGAGRFGTRFGSAAHLEIVDGVVYPLRDLDPRADTSIEMEPEPVESFVARFR